MATDRRITAPTLYELEADPPARAPSSDGRSPGRGLSPQVGSPRVTDLPDTPRHWWSRRPNYDKQTAEVHAAAATEKAITTFLRNRTGREQAAQEYVLQAGKREHLYMLHQANASQAEATLLSAMTDRPGTRRARVP